MISPKIESYFTSFLKNSDVEAYLVTCLYLNEGIFDLGKLYNESKERVDDAFLIDDIMEILLIILTPEERNEKAIAFKSEIGRTYYAKFYLGVFTYITKNEYCALMGSMII